MLLPPPVARTIRLIGLAALALLATAVVSPTSPASAVHSEAGATTNWRWPLDPPRSIVRPFIAPPTPYAAGHRGIDIGAVPDSPVYAPADGIVHFAGVVVDRPVLSIQHSDGLLSSFEPVVSALTAGTSIHRGEVIGTLQAGHCSVPCLHFGVRRNGEYLSPLFYLGGIPHSILLPTRPLR